GFASQSPETGVSTRGCLKVENQWVAFCLMRAGSPANTGAAGAMHRVDCFAGKPAPTGIA
ncbi:hypothetical protein, partial [Pseudomonas putida]|uniref:hypothetical protein n=1 Tax=Pseudomonas putida TaxID=303 RepID=UPI00216A9178